MSTPSNIRDKPTNRKTRNKTLSNLIISPIIDSVLSIKRNFPIRRDSRIKSESPVGNKSNPFFSKGGKTSRYSRKQNRKTRKNKSF